MRRVFPIFLWMVLLVAGEGRDPRSASKAEPSTTGLYGQLTPKVKLTQFSARLVDDRGRALPYRVTYPENAAGLPVIVWSHGMYGSQDNYQPLVEHWARHGYLVVQPSHSDSLKYGHGRLSEGFALSTRDWAQRPADVCLLLDRLSIDSKLSAVGDWSRIGVGGHSFGAHTTQLLAGARPKVGGDLSDPRPKAFLAISPQGESRLLQGDSWSGLTRPMLFVSGDLDESPTGDPPSWRRDPFENCPPGQKYLLWVKDAHHNFGGISGVTRRSSPRRPEQVEVVKSASLAFWDSYLKSSNAARTVLERGRLGGQSQDLYTWTKR